MEARDGIAQIDDGIWAVSDYFRLLPGVYLPLSGRIIRLQSGGLLIYSPMKFSEGMVEEIKKLGEVTAIFAPNLFHNTYIFRTKQQFPEASLVAPLGMESKKKEIIFDEFVGPGPSYTLGEDFDHVFVHGASKFNEVVLRHRATNSLIVADFFFNVQETKGWLSKFVLGKLSDAYGRPAQSKLWQRFMDDKDDFAKSAREVLALDFDKVHCSHGELIQDAAPVMEKELAWLFE